MSDSDPFQQGYTRIYDAAVEFRAFQEKAPDLIKTSCHRMPRFASLERMFSFYVQGDRATSMQAMGTVEAWFGQRSMFRQDFEGKLGVEAGAALLYSKGPTGEVAVTLHPCKSNLGRVHEDLIHLRVGKLTAHQLLKRIPSDVADLVAYGHVSSLDSTPTWGERLRIWYLRHARAMQVEGKYARPAAWSYAAFGLGFLTRTAVSAAMVAVLKPIGLAAAVSLLLYLGYATLAGLIPRP